MRARKYQGPLNKGIKVLGDPASKQVPPLYQAKFISRRSFSDMPFHIYPYLISGINIVFGNIEDP
jgi:hypothetical protein